MASDLVLVTGANGFVGSALCDALALADRRLRRAVRSAGLDTRGDAGSPQTFAVGSFSAHTDWMPALRDVDTVVHLAARAHASDKGGGDVLMQYRQTNVEATEKLARAALQSGVRRFVYMSSIKVNGERTLGHAFTELDPPRPEDAYGFSKWEAEQTLRQAASGSAMQVVVLRPPLVYGPGVKGNFLRLLEATRRGLPLPFASIHNHRSMIFLGNLVDAVLACVHAPDAAGKTYLVSDGEDVSTPDLIRAIANALDVKARLVPCPVSLLAMAAALLGKRSELEKLTGSLTVDSSRIRSDLGWRPRFSLAQGLAETARWYRERAGA